MLLMQNLIDPHVLFDREKKKMRGGKKKMTEESDGNGLTKQDRKVYFIYPNRSV